MLWLTDIAHKYDAWLLIDDAHAAIALIIVGALEIGNAEADVPSAAKRLTPTLR